MKIIVKNGEGRPINLGKFYSPQWASFESTVEWHDCPEATEDKEYWGELVTDTDMYGNNPYSYWRIVPQQQEKQTMI